MMTLWMRLLGAVQGTGNFVRTIEGESNMLPKTDRVTLSYSTSNIIAISDGGNDYITRIGAPPSPLWQQFKIDYKQPEVSLWFVFTSTERWKKWEPQSTRLFCATSDVLLFIRNGADGKVEFRGGSITSPPAVPVVLIPDLFDSGDVEEIACSNDGQSPFFGVRVKSKWMFCRLKPKYEARLQCIDINNDWYEIYGWTAEENEKTLEKILFRTSSGTITELVGAFSHQTEEIVITRNSKTVEVSRCCIVGHDANGKPFAWTKYSSNANIAPNEATIEQVENLWKLTPVLNVYVSRGCFTISNSEGGVVWGDSGIDATNNSTEVTNLCQTDAVDISGVYRLLTDIVSSWGNLAGITGIQAEGDVFALHKGESVATWGAVERIPSDVVKNNIQEFALCPGGFVSRSSTNEVTSNIPGTEWLINTLNGTNAILQTTYSAMITAYAPQYGIISRIYPEPCMIVGQRRDGAIQWDNGDVPTFILDEGNYVHELNAAILQNSNTSLVTITGGCTVGEWTPLSICSDPCGGSISYARNVVLGPNIYSIEDCPVSEGQSIEVSRVESCEDLDKCSYSQDDKRIAIIGIALGIVMLGAAVACVLIKRQRKKSSEVAVIQQPVWSILAPNVCAANE